MPPSVNQCYATNFTTKRRFISREYKEWKDEIKLIIGHSEKKWRIVGDNLLSIEYNFYFPIYNKDKTVKKKDTANFEKPLSDGLCECIEGLEDKNFKRIVLEKHHSERDEVEVIIREL